MTGITLTTAIKGSFGDLEYYLTTMKAGQAVKTLRPLGELQPEPDQERIESMVQYLRQDERFLSPLIVAVAGENPGFISLEIDEPDQIFPPPPPPIPWIWAYSASTQPPNCSYSPDITDWNRCDKPSNPAAGT